MAGRLDIDWDAQPLGRMADRALSVVLGCGRSTVRDARRRRGIAPCRPPNAGRRPTVDWDAQPLGRVPDAYIARALGKTPSAVHAARVRRGIPNCGNNYHIDWDRQPLGDVPDRHIATTLGVDVSTVTGARRRRGVPIARVAFRCMCGAVMPAKTVARRWCSKRCFDVWHRARREAHPALAESYVTIAALDRRIKAAESGTKGSQDVSEDE